MSVIIRLAAEFIEKMNNPAYGQLVNEEYTLKYSELIQEEGFQNLLMQEISNIKDTEELTSYGWIWLLKWCHVNNAELPIEVARKLMLKWQNVFMQMAIIELYTYKEDEFNAKEGLANEWLYLVIDDVITNTPNSEKDTPEIEVNTKDAENLLIAFLQVGISCEYFSSSVLLIMNGPSPSSPGRWRRW